MGWAGGATAAQADTVYEIVGNWQPGTPDTLKKGDNVASVWRFNVNDDAPAPSNDPVDNVTVTFTAHGGEFTEIPGACLTEAADPAVPLDPVSAIQDGGSTLVCNVGTRDQGTSELMLTGLRVVGNTGEITFVEAEVGGVTAELPPLNIVNPFAMDMKFDGGAISSIGEGSEQLIRFPWSLRHGPGGEPGPDSVSYTLSFTHTGGSNLRLKPNACAPIDRSFGNHPFSDDAHAAEKTAPFPATCTLTKTTGTDRYILTISGIDYSKNTLPSEDSMNGQVPLEQGWDVVASGMMQLAITYGEPGQVNFTSTEPTYTGAVTGTQVTGLTANNANQVAVSRGSRTGGWVLNQVGLPGTVWADTSRAAPGDLVRAAVSFRPPETAGKTNYGCSILDTKYVTFERVTTGSLGAGSEVNPYPGSGGIRYWYYVGNGVSNNVNPNSPNYNPDTFSCETGWGTSDWTNSPPADLGAVKAVRIHIPYSAAAGINETDSAGIARNQIESRVKQGVAAGQDVWTWAGFYDSEAKDPKWQYPFRLASDGKPGYGVYTPGTRYPWTSIGRDLLRVVSAKPVIEKTADQDVTMPGATVQFSLTYKAAALSTFDAHDAVIVDVLPEGTEYVPGSASVEPTSVNGRTLTWEIPTLPTNQERVLTYSVRVSDDAEPGQTFTNNASFSIAGQTAKASDSVKIRDGGFVQLTKNAEADKVPHASGTAENSWTVRLTSHDTQPTAFTDTIDVLPFNGDGRGTSFSGTYKLKEAVQAVSGATVYYTTADPATLVDDPKDPSNGAPGDVSGNTVNWSTTYTEDATAVRVIGPALKPSQQQEFTISVVTADATYEDRYVNRAESRSARHQLKMRTSSAFEIGAVNSVTIKKFVQDTNGVWHDANNIDNYPKYQAGDTVPYRLVVTNTGDETLKNLVIEDDKVDLAKLDPLPEGLTLLNGKAVIAELLPGEANRVVITYDVTLAAGTGEGSLVNIACVVPDAEAEGAPEEDCDPAGITVLPSSLAWEKIAAGTPDVERLAGSEWELTPVDANDQPTGDAIAVTDCVVVSAADCDGADIDPEPGKFLVKPLDDGRYRLVETRAPAGYQLDPTPRYIDVLGATVIEQPIENEQSTGPVLPLTGGMGTFAIFLGAGGVGVLVLLGLWLQRRRGQVVRN
ncbi:DUF7507 domain-containing protein [Leucobacter aridicollis]|uniref:DUF7507 domain-containing protein n=1 Tax=Leucobacter aridicollis TaxID=283878 RepID=UPI0021025055|nr:SpaA isopeptide-forming pilin-related protein [Leucobacter aridicollis]UTX53263.1 DUF11 domain-containing protein [Leucobacter aridicollis]